MFVGHNPTCVSMLAPTAGGSYGEPPCEPPLNRKAPLWGSGAMPLETLAISPIPGYQIVFAFISW